MFLEVNRDSTVCWGRGAQDGHLDFHTAPELQEGGTEREREREREREDGCHSKANDDLG